MKYSTDSFSGFSVNDIEVARKFYTEILELSLVDDSMGLMFDIPGGGQFFVYEKTDHQPATFTVLNFVVSDIDQAVDELRGHGVVFERYDLENGAVQDENGVLRGLSANRGPDIAWFTDPAGNVLSLLQTK